MIFGCPKDPEGCHTAVRKKWLRLPRYGFKHILKNGQKWMKNFDHEQAWTLFTGKCEVYQRKEGSLEVKTWMIKS